jgi:cytochrome c biogenesis protein CcmG/thiol:disulfide interchange protein DsbE
LPSTSSSAPPDAEASDGEPSDPAGSGPTRRGKWVLAAIALAVVLVVGGITAAVVASSSGSGSGDHVVPRALSAKVGEAAPDFSLTTLDGKEVRLSDYKGTPVVLNFWASWCTPCRKEFPLLRRNLAKANGAWHLVGVNTQDLIESDGRSFARRQKADWPNGYDAEAAVKKGYGVTGLPETFFIDADGIIRSHIILGLDQETLDAQLAKIGAG